MFRVHEPADYIDKTYKPNLHAIFTLLQSFTYFHVLLTSHKTGKCCSSCLGIFLGDSRLMTVRFRIYYKAITNSTSVNFNHVLCLRL
jgi:hypothetical protein